MAAPDGWYLSEQWDSVGLSEQIAHLRLPKVTAIVTGPVRRRYLFVSEALHVTTQIK
jgi:hypothetical protein